MADMIVPKIIIFNVLLILYGEASTKFIDGDLVSSLLRTNHWKDISHMIFYSCETSKYELCSTVRELSSNAITTLIIAHFNGDFTEYTTEQHTIFVLDIACNFTQNLLKKANEHQLFSAPHKWLIVVHDPNQFRVDMAFENIDLLLDSDLIIAEKQISDVVPNRYDLAKIYKIKPDMEIIFERFGTFAAGVFKTDTHYVPVAATRRQNLRNTTWNTALVVTHDETHKHLLDKREKHIDSIVKVNYVFMLHLQDFLNVRMNFSYERSWGYLRNDSQWTGMIGAMVRKEVDIGGTPAFFTSVRVAVVDYIAMTTKTQSKFVFRAPKLSYVQNVYTLPFDARVWVACAVCVAATTLTLYVGVKWERYQKRHQATCHEVELQAMDIVFIALAAVCQQGASTVPPSPAARIVTVLMYTALMFLYTSYSANIVALLQSSSTAIRTLDDLLHSRLAVGVDDTVFNRFYFSDATEPTQRSLYLQKVAPPGAQPHFFGLEEGVRRMRSGLFAFHMETGCGYKLVLDTFEEDEKCGLQEISFLQSTSPWVAVQKNASIKEILKIGLRKIMESGIQSREVAQIYTSKPVCTTSGSSFAGVTIIDAYPAAYIFLIGVVAACGIFILELLAKQCASRL